MRRGVRGAMYWCVLRAGPALMLLVALFFFPASAWASTTPSATSGLTMQVNAGFHMRYRGWVPVHVALSNTGADFSGTLSIGISSPAPPYRRSSVSPSGYQEPIHLPRGAQQQVTMYIPPLLAPSAFSQFEPQSLVINLLDRRGNVIRAQISTPTPLVLQW